MRDVVAIDPGCHRSAFVRFDGVGVRERGIVANADLLRQFRAWADGPRPASVVLEQIESYGMAVGREIFETVFWTGRFFQVARWLFGSSVLVTRMPRRAVKLHLCASPRAKDANIRAALLDRFGGSAAKGTKRAPGPLYGVKADEWAALALAVTWWETERVTGAATRLQRDTETR